MLLNIFSLLVIFTLFKNEIMFLQFVLIGYCAIYSDIYRVINGYDNCANVCGRKTSSEPEPEFACKGADMTNKK